MNRPTSRRQVRESGGELPLSPEVRTQSPARNGAFGDTMNLKGCVLGPAPFPGLNLVQEGSAKRESTLTGGLSKEGPLGGGETATEIHTTNLDMLSSLVNTCHIGHFVELWDDHPMDDIWEKRELFREWVAAAKAKLGATNNADVAPVMEIAPTSLNKYLGKSLTHKPSPDTLKLLGDFLGRDYRLLLDEPSFAPAGISASAWTDVSTRTRILASAMFEDLKGMPEDEQEAYYQLWKQGVAIGRARMAVEVKKKTSGSMGGKKP